MGRSRVIPLPAPGHVQGDAVVVRVIVPVGKPARIMWRCSCGATGSSTWNNFRRQEMACRHARRTG